LVEGVQLHKKCFQSGLFHSDQGCGYGYNCAIHDELLSLGPLPEWRF
jgi:hypothetical protein